MSWLSYESFSILSGVFCQKKVSFPVETAVTGRIIIIAEENCKYQGIYCFILK